MKGYIWFDMDGTIADFYGVEGWLDHLMNESVYPYEKATPLIHMCSFAKVLNRLQREGYCIGIISWFSKGGTAEYNTKVKKAKEKWLKKHLASVNWDKINIVPYGTPKENYAKSENDILFDDEEKNRENWTGIAFNVFNIMNILKTLK